MYDARCCPNAFDPISSIVAIVERLASPWECKQSADAELLRNRSFAVLISESTASARPRHMEMRMGLMADRCAVFSAEFDPISYSQESALDARVETKSVNGKPRDLSRGAASTKTDLKASSIVMATVNAGRGSPDFMAFRISGRGKTLYLSFESSAKCASN